MELDFSKLTSEHMDFDVSEPDYDKPDGSKWIVGVDQNGNVDILKWPNVHYNFLDDGITPENLGMSDHVDDAPGVYEWICDLELEYDVHGWVDGWHFVAVKSTLLYKLPD